MEAYIKIVSSNTVGVENCILWLIELLAKVRVQKCDKIVM
jgi:hypothetical protein